MLRYLTEVKRVDTSKGNWGYNEAVQYIPGKFHVCHVKGDKVCVLPIDDL